MENEAIILRSELELEAVTLVLDGAEWFEVFMWMPSVPVIIRKVAQQIRHLMPEIAFELDQISKSLDDIFETS